jgi:uncharacterized lipoprotein
MMKPLLLLVLALILSGCEIDNEVKPANREYKTFYTLGAQDALTEAGYPDGEAVDISEALADRIFNAH